VTGSQQSLAAGFAPECRDSGSHVSTRHQNSKELGFPDRAMPPGFGRSVLPGWDLGEEERGSFILSYCQRCANPPCSKQLLPFSPLSVFLPSWGIWFRPWAGGPRPSESPPGGLVLGLLRPLLNAKSLMVMPSEAIVPSCEQIQRALLRQSKLKNCRGQSQRASEQKAYLSG
jgi:hypothetical protein